MVERRSEEPRVVGSNPTLGTIWGGVSDQEPEALAGNKDSRYLLIIFMERRSLGRKR